MAVEHEQVIDELRHLRDEFRFSIREVHDRLDKQDLNHAAEYLREFGYFLERNPDFMKRQQERAEKTQERDIAMHYIARMLHLNNLKSKASWLALGITTGFLFALGNALFSPFGNLGDWIHITARALAGR